MRTAGCWSWSREYAAYAMSWSSPPTGSSASAPSHTPREEADKLAAACAGLTSLGHGISRQFGADAHPRQVMVEFNGGFLFIRGAGDGSRLAVVTEMSIDPALVAQQMQATVLMLGERAMSTPRRSI